ncbi:YebC-like protein [Lophium mytilinum]|uniref:YebC-like protein n=1 Tax=Lophium mytilinum TaxID=390894 RepID=A0A6A6QGL3_9PEZI|nr:YebC-like protein [Lophium mytilinum]
MSTAPRRLLTKAWSSDLYTCAACRHSRFLTTSASLQSGHNKWSTIKHAKGKNDAVKNKQRSIYSSIIANESKLYGADPNSNPRLVVAISNAKKNGVPKSVIESAIARGQGVSASGAALESVVVEAILQSSVAAVIDCQTESKLRTLMDVRRIIKDHGGNVTPTNYLFEKKGRIVFQEKENVGVEEVLSPALDCGALDVLENEDGKVVVFTETNDTKGTAHALAAELGIEIESSDIIWDPNAETKVELESVDAAKNLRSFLDELQEVSEVQGVYMNLSRGSLDEELWADLRDRAEV